MTGMAEFLGRGVAAACKEQVRIDVRDMDAVQGMTYDILQKVRQSEDEVRNLRKLSSDCQVGKLKCSDDMGAVSTSVEEGANKKVGKCEKRVV